MSPRLSATLLAVAALFSLPFAAPAQQLQPVAAELLTLAPGPFDRLEVMP